MAFFSAQTQMVKCSIKGQDAAQIGGTPRKSGTFKFTVSAWCFGTNTSGQFGHHDYILVVQ